jgi:glycosyltransferase involved in cell wall biosynthesis
VRETVDMPGFDPEPFAIMARADMFVLSSRYEGFGQVLLQAMTCAVPVVATDCPSGPREIMRDGVDGVLVPPEDPDALGEAMARLMSDPELRDQMGARARERSEDFAPARIWAMWDRVIESVVG